MSLFIYLQGCTEMTGAVELYERVGRKRRYAMFGA